MTIEELIKATALRKPSKIALIGGEAKVTYCQLWDYCLMTAQKLHKRFDIQKGDRVILATTESIEFV